MKLAGTIIGTLLLLSASIGDLLAEPTDIEVRIISKDAKFVGTSMGGVLITLRDADTGNLLATGVTVGSTGDTKKIIKEPRARGRAISDAGSAVFAATVDLDAPTLMIVSAYGPLAQRQAANTVSATQWVVPGKHITGGDGWLLELPGLVVDVLAPPTHLKLKGHPRTVRLVANVTMMCGCPIEPDGLWDANAVEVAALLTLDGRPAGRVSLTYAGQTSQFAAEITVVEPGTYDAHVYAYQEDNGNTGVDRVTFVVVE